MFAHYTAGGTCYTAVLAFLSRNIVVLTRVMFKVLRGCALARSRRFRVRRLPHRRITRDRLVFVWSVGWSSKGAGGDGDVYESRCALAGTFFYRRAGGG